MARGRLRLLRRLYGAIGRKHCPACHALARNRVRRPGQCGELGRVGYMLAVACALPIFARLAEIAGRKTFFLSGFASFAILSTLCGLAPTLASLTGLRVLLGVGAAMTGANSVVILVTAAGPERRGKALGIMAAAQAVGFALGPTLGGLLLGTLGWRWVFWVNVPLSVAAFVLSWLIVPKTAAFAGDKRFDWPGAMLLVPGLATLLVAIAQFHAWGFSPLLVACVVAAPILLAGFVWRELGTAFPLVDCGCFAPVPSRPARLAFCSPTRCFSQCSLRCRTLSCAAIAISR